MCINKYQSSKTKKLINLINEDLQKNKILTL